MQKINKLYIAEIEGDEPVLINASTEIEAMLKFESYNHSKSDDVFDLALKSMENIEQMIKLYEVFFGEMIILFGIVDESIYRYPHITTL